MRPLICRLLKTGKRLLRDSEIKPPVSIFVAHTRRIGTHDVFFLLHIRCAMAYMMCHGIHDVPSTEEAPINNPFQECHRITLRIRPDVYDAVRRSAFENFRSMTAEINELLVEAIKKTEEAKPGSSSSVSE